MAGRRDPDHDDYCLNGYEYLFEPHLLQGKVAFITGGGSGIGFRIAEIFMRHGCDTVIASRRLEKVEEVCFCEISTFKEVLFYFVQSAKTLWNCTKRECFPLQMDVRKVDIILYAVGCLSFCILFSMMLLRRR